MREPYKTGIPLSLAIVLFGGYIAYTSLGSHVSTVPSFELPASIESAGGQITPREIPEGSREFVSTQYKFSVLYPDDLEVKEFPEAGGARTFTFQNTQVPNGFQMYVLPYHETTISEERFLVDVPSGVRNDEKIIELDGVSASKFYSKNTMLGDTVEVWAIHNGFLYEINTVKTLEGLIDEVVRHWQFL
jgi:hypothetical protein